MGAFLYVVGIVILGVAQGAEHGGVVGFSIIGAGLVVIGAVAAIVDYLRP